MGVEGTGEVLSPDCGAMMTLEELKKLNEYAKKHIQMPSVVETQEQADAFTIIDKALGIDHKWKIGDKFYYLSVYLPTDVK